VFTYYKYLETSLRRFNIRIGKVQAAALVKLCTTLCITFEWSTGHVLLAQPVL